MEDIVKKAVGGGLDEEEFGPLIELTKTKPNPITEVAFDAFIFSHEFLKAYAVYIIKSGQRGKLYGFEIEPDILTGNEFIDMVKEKLSCELVLAEDRLEYLRRFL